MYTCAHNCRIQQLIPTHKPILKPSESNSQIRVLVTPLPPAGFGHNSPISSAVIFFVWCKVLTFYNLTFTIAHKVQHYWTIKCNTYCILLMTIDTNTDVHRLTDMCTERHAHTRMQTQTHTHEHRHTHTHAHTHAQRQTQTDRHRHRQTQTQTHTDAHTHTPATKKQKCTLNLTVWSPEIQVRNVNNPHQEQPAHTTTHMHVQI